MATLAGLVEQWEQSANTLIDDGYKSTRSLMMEFKMTGWPAELSIEVEPAGGHQFACMHASGRLALAVARRSPTSYSRGFDGNIYCLAWWQCCYSDPDEDSLHAWPAQCCTPCRAARRRRRGHPIKIWRIWSVCRALCVPTTTSVIRSKAVFKSKNTKCKNFVNRLHGVLNVVKK